ncbi:alcohol dehydrogenase [Westerdykella ornata]|uniref:Alcohol dehydrogenase n=1 Tax=Westerdykella ornata TaxID=318751 RepID=A0A6A6JSS9_WESOR|nr:alcohol dehydrogenase [Westerdykella ornata]KAF2278039.1 alcohol dehydrogenase [Westerdykella ornata]
MLSHIAIVTALASISIAATLSQANATYEYIVVGSGPGGGPLAANLARAGHTVLLLEAGDDQGSNPNISQILNFNRAGNDPSTRWDFFVKHSDDQDREAKYEHLVWKKEDEGFYVGTNPPGNAQQLGIYYPRAGTLGGCAMHNAGVSAMPPAADWDHIADMTGDETWRAANMRKYLTKIENAVYTPNDRNHGHSGYLTLTQSGVNVANSSDGRTLIEAMAQALGLGNVAIEDLLKRDMNADDAQRDESTGIFGQLRHADAQGRRVGTNTYIRATLKDPQAFPLTVQLNSLVTKVLFTASNSSSPTAVGVEYLYGKSLYSADPRYNASAEGEVRQVFASREVIIAGGVFNTPQIMKLSGIGPAAELEKHNIPVIVDLPGVGARMADNYETSLISLASRDLINTSGTHAVMLKSSVAAGRERDLYLFCGAFSFEGYWPGFPTDYGKSQYECAVVYIPSRNAGSVLLRSSNPRDTPEINFRFYENGGDQDLTAMLEGVKWARAVFQNVSSSLGPWKEVHPCKHPRTDCSEEEQKDWIRLQTYSHHATSTCQIGADGDKMAVLDSKFRVRGVKRLRVVDASAFPRVPGAFPVLPTFVLSEKATESILEDVRKGRE